MKNTHPKIGAQHHMLGAMSEASVRDALLKILLVLIRDKGNAWREQAENNLLAIFNQWKSEQGSRNPKTYRGAKGLGARKAISFELAAPYECVQDFYCAHDYVSFCLFLLRSNYPPLMGLVKEEDISDLLSVSALIEPEMTRLDSILSVAEILLDATTRDRVRLSRRNDSLMKLIAEAGPAVKRDAKAIENLAVARPKGAAANKQSAEKRKANLRKAAVDYFLANPLHSVCECTSFLLARGIGTQRTIKDGISGCKSIALETLKKKSEKQG